MNLYSTCNLQQKNNKYSFSNKCGLSLDGFSKLKLLHFSLYPAVLPEGIADESPDITTIILILLAVIILAVMIVFFLIFSRRRRKNKAKGIFCFPLYCVMFDFQNCDLIAEPNDVCD